jgi:hypothetical protein
MMSDMVGHYIYIYSMLLELNIMFQVWTIWREVNADWFHQSLQSMLLNHVSLGYVIDPFPTVNFTKVLG